MKQEMTIMQKAIFTAIKEHNNERSDDLGKYNKGIKFVSMGRYIHEGYQEFTVCSDGNTMVKYEVKCSFKPANKYEDNIVKYMVNIYSDGSMGIYFDGTEYKA